MIGRSLPPSTPSKYRSIEQTAEQVATDRSKIGHMLGEWVVGTEHVLDNCSRTCSPILRRLRVLGPTVQPVRRKVRTGQGPREIQYPQYNRVHYRTYSGLALEILLVINSPGPEATFMGHIRAQTNQYPEYRDGGLTLLCMAKRGGLVRHIKGFQTTEEDRAKHLSTGNSVLETGYGGRKGCLSKKQGGPS